MDDYLKEYDWARRIRRPNEFRYNLGLSALYRINFCLKDYLNHCGANQGIKHFR